MGVARVVESYLHRDGDYHRNLENPVFRIFSVKLFNAEYMLDDFFIPYSVELCPGTTIKL